jgi:hypothetical protein
MITCVVCGAWNRNGTKYCSACGANAKAGVLDVRICNRCGLVARRSAKSCGHCGPGTTLLNVEFPATAFSIVSIIVSVATLLSMKAEFFLGLFGLFAWVYAAAWAEWIVHVYPIISGIETFLLYSLTLAFVWVQTFGILLVGWVAYIWLWLRHPDE